MPRQLSPREDGPTAREALDDVIADLKPGDAVFIVVVPQDATCKDKRFWTHSSAFHTWQLSYAATALQAHATMSFIKDKELQ